LGVASFAKPKLKAGLRLAHYLQARTLAFSRFVARRYEEQRKTVFVIQKFQLPLWKNCFELTTSEKINYWVELSDYDLETADAMLQTKRYLYVGFMC